MRGGWSSRSSNGQKIERLFVGGQGEQLSPRFVFERADGHGAEVERGDLKVHSPLSYPPVESIIPDYGANGRAGRLETARRIPCGEFALRVPREICFNSADPHNHHALQWRVSWPCRCLIASCERRSRRWAASTVIAGQLTDGKRPVRGGEEAHSAKSSPRIAGEESVWLRRALSWRQPPVTFVGFGLGTEP